MDTDLFVVLENSVGISTIDGIFFRREDAELYINTKSKLLKDFDLDSADSHFTIVGNVFINKFFRLAAFYRKD